MKLSTKAITVLGAGSWGTAIAIHLAKVGYLVNLWARHLGDMATHRENTRYLAGIKFPDNLIVIDELRLSLSAEIIIIAVPSHAFRELLMTMQPHLTNQQIVVWLTKGLDPQNHELLHQTAQSILPDNTLAVLAGPSFAREVAQGLPTAITLACQHPIIAQQLIEIFHQQKLRVYWTKDLIGVGLGGAFKNVLAIAVGIADGLQCGANAQAALMTRGMAEMQRLGKVLGAHPETLMGLAGLGDLILTCSNNQSRNRRLGIALGQGESLAQAQQAIDQVVEGVNTAAEIYHLAKQHEVEMPIIMQVYHVLYQNLSPQKAVLELLQRRPTIE